MPIRSSTSPSLPSLVVEVLEAPGLVHPGGDAELIDTAEARERRIQHRVGIVQAVRPPRERRDLAADLAHFGSHAIELVAAAGCQHELAAKRTERDCAAAPESAGGAG